MSDYGIYFVTDRELCGQRGVVETVRRAVDGGVSTVQLRDKHSGLDEQLRQIEQLAAVIDGRARFVVNDRVDAAVAARERGLPIDGVHVGQGDDSALRARELLGSDAIVGLTANTPEHLLGLQRLPSGTVDYLGVGVIRPTSTKPDHPAPLGVDGFERFASESGMPCVAIGGIVAEDLAPLRRAGAAGVAVVSLLCSARDPEAAAQDLVAYWRQ